MRSVLIAVLVVAGSGLQAQQSPSAEYIRLGGRVIAVERREVAAVSVTVAPGAATVHLGETQQFTATVTGTTNTGVTWSTEPAGPAYGSITNGLYTPPDTIPSSPTVTVRATSLADTSKTATATITLVAATCPLSLYSATVPNGGGTVSLNVQCQAGVGWVASVPPDAPWVGLSKTSGAGTESLNLIVQANGPSTGARSAYLTIAGQTFTLTQQAAAMLTIDPPTASMAHGETKRFTALANGTPVVANWTVASGVGSITSLGDYTAPYIVQPTETSVTIRADYPAGSAIGTAAITLAEYAPPGAMGVAPGSGSTLTQTFTVTASDVHGAYALDYVWVNFNSGIDQYYNGCHIQINTTTEPVFGNAVQLVLDGGGLSNAAGFGTATVIENAQCRVDLATSSISRSGNVVTMNLAVTFKPGFIGLKGVYGKSRNLNLITSEWQQIGTWNLSANLPALVPTLAIDSPAPGATVLGDVLINGWAIDNAQQVENPIAGVEIYVDGQLQPGTTYGTARQDVCSVYPGRHRCPNVGYQLTWNSRYWANGTHSIRVVARDFDNPSKASELTRTVTVNNPPGVPLVISPSPSWVRIASPANAPRLPIEQKQFTATLSGVQWPVTWSLSPPAGFLWGSVTAQGLYTGPIEYGSAGSQQTLTAVLNADPTKSASTTITIMGVLTPDRWALSRGQRQWFLGSVPMVSYSADRGTVDQNGWYTAPTDYTGPVTIQAHSIYDWNAIFVATATIQ